MKSPGRIRTVLVAAIFLALSVSPALAWKPVSHVFLAEVALRDALDDGMITVYTVDYANKAVRRDGNGNPVKLGDYPVHPAILEAIGAYPEIYRAGVFGPDAYPDILTGQQIIHPAGRVTPGENDDDLNPGGTGPNAWLQHLWDAAYTTGDTNAVRSLQARAFVAGYLTHAAGDMYAHTLINHFAGGAFHFVEDGAKHILLEGYLAKRLPPLSSWNARVDGLEDWIYRNMVYAPPGSDLEGLLKGENRKLSVPSVFSRLRNEIQTEIDAYYGALAGYNRRIQEKTDAAARCAVNDFTCSKTILFAQAAAIAAEKANFVLRNRPIAAYKERWRDDIDEGLKAWPRLSHELALAIFFTPPAMGERYGKADIGRAKTLVGDYVLRHLLSMAGAPDFVGLTADAIRQIIKAVIDALGIPVLAQVVKEMTADLFGFLLRNAFGITEKELKDYLESPERWFDPVMNNPGFNSDGGTLISLAEFNHRELGILDDGFSNPDNPETLDWIRVPSAYNSATLSKLLLLGPDSINRILKDLGSTTVFRGENLLLGFAETLDGANQWHANPERLVFARDCADYRRIFMRQTGEGDCGKDALVIRPFGAALGGGESSAFDVLPPDPIVWDTYGRVEGDRFDLLTDHDVRYSAPAAVKSAATVTLKARAGDDSGRENRARVKLIPGRGPSVGIGSMKRQSFIWYGSGDGTTWTDPCNWYEKEECSDAYPGDDHEREDDVTLPRKEGATAHVFLPRGVRLHSIVMKAGSSIAGQAVEVSKLFEWRGGTIYSGVHIAKGARMQIGADILNISVGTPKGFMPPNLVLLLQASRGLGIIENDGDIVWTGGELRLGVGASILNRGRFFAKTADGQITGEQCCVTDNTFVNEGEIVISRAPVFGMTAPGEIEIPVTSDGVTVTIDDLLSPDVTIGVTEPGRATFDGVGLIHRGKVTVPDGNALTLDIGNHILEEGSKIVGGGRTLLRGRRVLLNGMVSLGVDTVFELAKGGQIAGTGGFRDAGTFTWTGGEITANLSVPLATTLTLGGFDEKHLNAVEKGGILRIDGSAVWDGVDDRIRLSGNAAVINNGVFTLRGRASLEGDCCVSNNSFRNAGSVVVAGGGGNPGDLTFRGVGLVNDGAVAAVGGDLTLDMGHHALNNAGRIAGMGRVRFTGDSVTLNGDVSLEAGANAELAAGVTTYGGILDGEGTFRGTGTFHWTGGAIRGSVTLAPGLEARISGDGERRLLSPDGKTGGRLVNRGHVEWTGKGKLLLTSPNGFLNANEGRIDAGGNAAVMAMACCTDPYTLVNEGIFSQAAGSTTTFDYAFFRNTGTLNLDGSLVFTAGNVSSFDQTGGVLRLNGGELRTAGTVALNGGTLTGNGTIAGNLLNSARIEPGAPVGTLTVTGNYAQTAAGSVAFDLSARDSDRLDVGKTVALGGTWSAALAGGFQPAVGTRVPVMTWASRTGGFAETGGMRVGEGILLTPEIGPNSFALVTTREPPDVPVYGDLTGEGRVTVMDAILALQIALGVVAATPSQMERGDVAPEPGVGPRAGQPFGDGRINVTDAIRMLRRAVGMETAWP